MSNQENICLSGNKSTLQPTARPSEMGKIFSYNGNSVTMRLRNGIVYVNLTEVAKSFPSKNLSHIINSQEIKEYCEALSEIQNCISADLLIVSKGGDVSKQGTWAHQKVALRVAQKLSPEFAVWVDTKIEELLTTGVATVSNDDEAIAYAMNVLQKRLEQAKAEKTMLEQQNNYLTNEIKQQAPKVQYVDNVLQSVNTYTVQQIAKELDTTANRLYAFLKEKRVMFRQSGIWMLTAKYNGKGYTKMRTHQFTRNDGSVGTSSYTVFTEKGRALIHGMMPERKEAVAL